MTIHVHSDHDYLGVSKPTGLPAPSGSTDAVNKAYADALAVLSVITATLTANQSDYAPTGWNASSVAEISVTGANRTVDTWAAPTGTGPIVKAIYVPIASSFGIVIPHQTGTTAANRVITATAASRTAAPGQTIWLFYSAAASRWVEFASTIPGAGGGSAVTLVTTLKTSGNHTLTTGCRYFKIRGVGAGGGAGGTAVAAAQSATAGGGGAGQSVEHMFTVPTPSSPGSVTLTYGTGGAGGANTGGTGSAGTASTAVYDGTTLTANGGAGGAGLAASNTPTQCAGGAGGTGSTGALISREGEAGGCGYQNFNVVMSGFGGSSILGAGGKAKSAEGAGSSSAGAAGTGYGAGGSGAALSSNPGIGAQVGGAGTAGAWVIEEFF